MVALLQKNIADAAPQVRSQVGLGNVENFSRQQMVDGGPLSDAIKNVAAFPIVTTYGVDIAGATPADIAIEAMWAVNPAARLPSGVFLFTSSHTKPFGTSIKGEGIGKTFLVIDVASFLKITGGPNYITSEFSDVTILLKRVPTADSYLLWADGVASINRNRAKVNNVEIRSFDGLPVGAYGVENYIRLSNLLNPQVDNVLIRGTFSCLASGGVGTQLLCRAVLVDGQTIDPILTNIKAGGFYSGIKLSDQVEGYFISDNYLVGVYEGIVNTTAPDGTLRPGGWISGNHINAVARGIYLKSKLGAIVTNNPVYRSDVFFDSDFVGIHLEGCIRSGIHHNDISTQADPGERDLIQITDCQGITGTGNTVSGAPATSTVFGIKHVGTNINIIWDDTIFNAVTTGFQTTTIDSDVTIGKHSFLGSVTTPYSIPTEKRSITVWRRGAHYNKVGSFSPAAADATETLVVGTAWQVAFYNFGAGSAAYTYNIELSKTGARTGDIFRFKIVLPSSAFPTVVIKNGVAGPALITLNTATSKRYSIEAVYTDTGQWILISAAEMLAV